jgi:HD domain.
MITEDRLHHILGVARKAYKIAKDLGKDENYARQMFALGWNHDIGYEFDPVNHENVGANILPNYKYAEFIRSHGLAPTQITKEWIIINLADMTTSPTGEEITIEDRLAEIESRYGKDHIWYKQSKEACDILNNILREMSLIYDI